MGERSVVPLWSEDAPTTDALTEVIRQGARKLLREAREAEVAGFVAQFQAEREDGSPRLVRNGYRTEREIQTGIAGVAVKVPRVRDRDPGEGEPLHFTRRHPGET